MPAIPFPFLNLKFAVPGTVDLVFVQEKAVVKSFPVKQPLGIAVKIISIDITGHGKSRVRGDDQGSASQLSGIGRSRQSPVTGNGRRPGFSFFVGPYPAMAATAE
jgi:hypothetical protein